MKPLLCALAILITATPSLAREGSDDDPIVARWTGGSLTQSQYQDWLLFQTFGEGPESLTNLVYLQSMAEAARTRGADTSASVRIAAEAQRQRALGAALDEHIRAQIEVPEAEIQARIESNPDAFRKPRKLRLANIFMFMPESEPERVRVREQMERILTRLAEGADFKELASRHSESQSRFHEGLIGLVKPEDLPPRVAEAVTSLEAGEWSGIIDHGGGLAIYLCESIREASRPTLSEVRAKFRQNLFSQKKRKLNQALNERLLAKASINLEGDPILQTPTFTLASGELRDLVEHRISDRPLESLNESQRYRLLQQWALAILRADYAQEQGLDHDPRIRAAIDWRMTHALAAQELRHRIDQQIGIPGENELRSLYERHSSKLISPDEYRVSAINFGGAELVSDPAKLASALVVAQRIEVGELPMKEAAKRWSRHPSATSGGDLGWRKRKELAQLDISLGKIIQSLGPEEYTGLLRFQSGLWLFKLMDRREPRPMTFEEARPLLADRWRSVRIKELEQTVFQKQLAALEVQYPNAEE